MDVKWLSAKVYNSKELRNLGIYGAPHLTGAAMAQSAKIPLFLNSLDRKIIHRKQNKVNTNYHELTINAARSYYMTNYMEIIC